MIINANKHNKVQDNILIIQYDRVYCILLYAIAKYHILHGVKQVQLRETIVNTLREKKIRWSRIMLFLMQSRLL